MKNKGFTLIELLVVIAIIGILASIVVVPLGNQTSKATSAKLQAELAQLPQIAIAHFTLNNNNYSGVCTGLTNAAKNGHAESGSNSTDGPNFSPIRASIDGDKNPEHFTSCGANKRKWIFAIRVKDRSNDITSNRYCVDSVSGLKTYTAKEARVNLPASTTIDTGPDHFFQSVGNTTFFTCP